VYDRSYDPLRYVPQIDAKKRKTFLKRTHCEGLGSSSSPLRPQSFVTVMARRLQILSPADATTRDKLSENAVTRSEAHGSNASCLRRARSHCHALTAADV
jgi:hypothetical protein